MPTFAHSDLLTALADFYNDTITIQANTPSRDAVGYPAPGWSNLSGHVNLKCRTAPVAVPLARREARQRQQTHSTERLAVVLSGRYDSITVLHRAVLNGQNYNIVTVEGDSEGMYTRLLLELVT